MDKTGNLQYGILQEGSYFGDISVINEEPNEYSYFYDHQNKDKQIQLLAIDGKVFNQICDKYPISKDVFHERAKKRKKMFQAFKTISLLKIMKSSKAIQNLMLSDQGQLQSFKTKNKLDCRLELCQMMVKL